MGPEDRRGIDEREKRHKGRGILTTKKLKIEILEA